MYGSHPIGRGSPPRAARARGGCGIAEPMRRSPRSLNWVAHGSEPVFIDSTQRPPERTPCVPPLKALRALCGTDAAMHIVPSPKFTSMRGVSLASTPSSPSFADWYKYGSRTRAMRLPSRCSTSELTCGGMKQSGRAVHACATRRAQARQGGSRTHCRCTIDVSTSLRDPGSPRPQILPSRSTNSPRPKRRDPGRQCLPGSHGEIVPGLPFGQPRTSRELRLTHHDFQGARGCIAWQSPSEDLQRPRALPRAKGD